MTDRLLLDYGLYLLSRDVRPETRMMFFEWPVEHLTRPDLRTVCLTLSTEEGGQEYAISFDFHRPTNDRKNPDSQPVCVRIRRNRNVNTRTA